MKQKRFRYISIGVSLVLFALTVIQAWSLWRMYQDQISVFERNVISILNRSAYDLSSKATVSQVLLSSGSSGKSLSSISSNSLSHVKVSKDTPDITGSFTFHFEWTYDSLSQKEMSSVQIRKDSLKVRKQSQIPLQLSIETNDSLTCMDYLRRFDSVMQQRLGAIGLLLPYQLECTPDRKFADHRSYRLSPDTVELTSGQYFQIHIKEIEGATIHLLIEAPYRKVLREMSGIFISAILIWLVLMLTTIYLLRTIFRQKSLEAMRQDFTHNITHELKTPIAVAYAANDALEHFGAFEDPQKKDRYLSVVRTQLESLSTMIERILSLSREEHENFQLQRSRFSLPDLILPLLENCRIRSDKPVLIDYTPVMIEIEGDRFHWDHIISNILDNAIKYSDTEVNIHIETLQTAQGIEIRISDQGMGMSASEQKRIFEKYYRVPTGNIHRSKGYGLGLYYVHLMLQKQGAQIRVDSRKNHGSTFIIYIPNHD